MRGFSLFEILIVIALIFVIGVIVLPSYRGFTSSNDLSVAVDVVVQSLSEAQRLARIGEEDSDWGVHIQEGRITIFKGTVFTAFNPVSDRFFIVSSNLTFSGPSDIIFSKFTGLPQQIGQITITSTVTEFKTLTINEQGTVNY